MHLSKWPAPWNEVDASWRYPKLIEGLSVSAIRCRRPIHHAEIPFIAATIVRSATHQKQIGLPLWGSPIDYDWIKS